MNTPRKNMIICFFFSCLFCTKALEDWRTAKIRQRPGLEEEWWGHSLVSAAPTEMSLGQERMGACATFSNLWIPLQPGQLTRVWSNTELRPLLGFILLIFRNNTSTVSEFPIENQWYFRTSIGTWEHAKGYVLSFSLIHSTLAEQSEPPWTGRNADDLKG